MQYRAAVFDMDGTILDTIEDLRNALNTVFRKHGFPERSEKETKRALGNGIARLVSDSLPENTPEEIRQALTRETAAYYQAHCNEKTKPYDGVIEVLRKIRERGILTAVVSNKIDPAVQILAKTTFPGLFDCAMGEKEKEGIRKKPAPDMVNAALKALNVDPKEAIYVGDSEVDFATAKNANLPCISVDWGFRDREELEKLHPDYLISRPEELLDILR